MLVYGLVPAFTFNCILRGEIAGSKVNRFNFLRKLSYCFSQCLCKPFILYHALCCVMYY